MPPRLTIGTLMIWVGGLAVVLAAFRVHFSLGSLVFGLLAVVTVRTGRYLATERARGRTVSWPGVAGNFGESLLVAAGSMVVVLLGYLLVELPLAMGGGTPPPMALGIQMILGLGLGLVLLRFVQWFLRHAIAELAPTPEPFAAVLTPSLGDWSGSEPPLAGNEPQPTTREVPRR